VQKTYVFLPYKPLWSGFVVLFQHITALFCMSFVSLAHHHRYRLYGPKDTATRYRIENRSKILQPFDYYNLVLEQLRYATLQRTLIMLYI